MRLLGGTRELFFRFGQADGLRLSHVLLEHCPVRDAHRVAAQISAGQLAAMLGEFETARRALSDAHELSSQLGERALEAWSRFFQGLAELLAGAIESAREYLEAGRALHRELGIRLGEARSLALLGDTFVMGNDNARANELLEAALAIHVAERDEWGQGQCHTFLGMNAEAIGGRLLSDTLVGDWGAAERHAGW
jgi:ATP/maltotriose-dependent transcriptional regulator MalT